MGYPPATAEARSSFAEAPRGSCPFCPPLSGAGRTGEEAQAGSRGGRGRPASLPGLVGRLALEIGLVRMGSPNRLRRHFEIAAGTLVLRVPDLLTIERSMD